MRIDLPNTFHRPVLFRKAGTTEYVGSFDVKQGRLEMLGKEYAQPFEIMKYAAEGVDGTAAYTETVGIKLADSVEFLTNSDHNPVKSGYQQQYEIIQMNQGSISTKTLVQIRSVTDGSCLTASLEENLLFYDCNLGNGDQIFEIEEVGLADFSDGFFIKNFVDDKFITFNRNGVGAALGTEKELAHLFYTAEGGDVGDTRNQVVIDANGTDEIYDRNRDLIRKQSGHVYDVQTGEMPLTGYEKEYALFRESDGNLMTERAHLGSTKSTNLFRIDQVNENVYKIRTGKGACLEYDNVSRGYKFKKCETTNMQLFELLNIEQKEVFDRIRPEVLVSEEGIFVELASKTGGAAYLGNKDNRLGVVGNKKKALHLNDRLEFVDTLVYQDGGILITPSDHIDGIMEVRMVKNQNDHKSTNLIVGGKCLTYKSVSQEFSLEPCKNKEGQNYRVVEERYKDNLYGNQTRRVDTVNSDIFVVVRYIKHGEMFKTEPVDLGNGGESGVESKPETQSSKTRTNPSLHDVMTITNSDKMNMRQAYRNTPFDKLTETELRQFENKQVHRMKMSEIQRLTHNKLSETEIEDVKERSKSMVHINTHYNNNRFIKSNWCLLQDNFKMNYMKENKVNETKAARWIAPNNQ
ncbi:hypothetical protein ECANGB1_1884 [Enterospora canceri]|uniref:Uncharacterized protein n=1 Tax=Enterospora canceri TaxID=1081671 RepID=A0A1Y1S8Z3_9MICR|nr:hypothetical protein ECANGB1_1884 [Enterospora canceri]